MKTDNEILERDLKIYRGDLELANTYLEHAQLCLFMHKHSHSFAADNAFLDCLRAQIRKRLKDVELNGNDYVKLPEQSIMLDTYVCNEDVGRFVSDLKEYSFMIASNLDRAAYWLGGLYSHAKDEKVKEKAKAAYTSIKQDLTTIKLAIPHFSSWLAKRKFEERLDAFSEMKEAYWHITPENDPEGGFYTEVDDDLIKMLHDITKYNQFIYPIHDAVLCMNSIYKSGDFYDIQELFEVVYGVVISFNCTIIDFCESVFADADEKENEKEANNGK